MFLHIIQDDYLLYYIAHIDICMHFIQFDGFFSYNEGETIEKVLSLAYVGHAGDVANRSSRCNYSYFAW